ncbi:Ger(x)C family spore germination protein [Pseudobacteroides cellulosolvens]|uniref:Germination protein, Ger(X)C family n=1 Tax=Pseudobacteroides cellulosolvens ATCC 35603 = DSM 2933 TaxID=398512 RepID=A0A0L6JT18_9FIRM|nr:Ger(x)C family spore germination protein [Pseudobacteroides cellulosolvens]KNY28839.1 germination protein, Ger(x)C family [Pseudobacteroides cellulosolvens ATCC 35603 = DSM 2933]
MKKILFSIVLLLLVICSTGCNIDFLPPRREIDDLHLVQVIGIDKLLDTSNNMMLTVASQKITDEGGGQETQGKSGEGTSNPGGKALIETSVGKTIFDAARNIQTHSDKTIFWAHTEYYLVSEEAAKENIVKYIDFFTRDHELRIDAKIYIVKGSTAKEVIEAVNKTEFFVIDKLKSLGRNIKLLSISEEMKVSELMRFIDLHHSSARVPCMELVNRERGNKKILDMDIYGYAIFKDLKLVGFIGKDISRGINLLTDKVDSSIVVVKDLSGQEVSIEITRNNTEVIPHFIGDNLTEVTIKAKVTSNLGEVHSHMKVLNENSIHYMEAQQSDILKREMEDVLKRVLEMKSDCLEICDKIRMKSPLKWHKIEKHWLQIIPTLRFNIEVESKIERTYDLREPSGYRGKE